MTQGKIELTNDVLTFDGIDDWLELPKGFPTIEKAITIEFWAKGENSLTECNTIFEANNAENTRVLVVAIPWDRRIYWDAGNGNGFDRIDKEVKIEEYNSWTHWAFVKDVAAGKMWIYRNGQIWEQGEGTQKSLAGIDRVTIGCLVNNSAFWKGSLTEFRIWNQVRTQAEILQNINVRLKGNEQGLSRYYPFNGDANDRTSNGAHGTINGATWTQEKLSIKVEEVSEPKTLKKKKRLIVCCDGTWNELASSYPTNVVKFTRSIKYTADDQTPQLISYISGCGTAEDDDLIERLGGGAFGWGIDRIIQDAYRFLCMNYDVDAQDEIYLVGFSRGAYTVRCLAGMIYKCGLLRRSKIREIPKAYHLYRDSKISPNDPKAQKFRKDNAKKIDTEKDYLQYRVPIKMLGCWDTVGALGIPDLTPWLPLVKLWNQKYEFFDAKLSPIVENAFHAVAIDEKRKTFPSTPMERNKKNPDQVVQQVLFIGEHGCVGGGTKEYRGLSDYSLQWMINQAKKLGLEFYSNENDSEEFQIKPDVTTKFDNRVTGFYALGGEEGRVIQSSKIVVHYSVVERLKTDPNYRPQNLNTILKDLIQIK